MLQFPFSLGRTDAPDLLFPIAALLNTTQHYTYSICVLCVVHSAAEQGASIRRVANRGELIWDGAACALNPQLCHCCAAQLGPLLGAPRLQRGMLCSAAVLCVSFVRRCRDSARWYLNANRTDNASRNSR